VEANDSNQAWEVRKSIRRARHKSVFEYHNFRFERDLGKEEHAGWQVFIGNRRYFPGKQDAKKNNIFGMRAWVKDTIRFSNWLSFDDVDESRSTQQRRDVSEAGLWETLATPLRIAPPPPSSEQFQFPSIPRSTQSPAARNTPLEGKVVRRGVQGSAADSQILLVHGKIAQLPRLRTQPPMAPFPLTVNNYEVDYFRNFEKLWPRRHGPWTQYASASITKKKLEKANIFDGSTKICVEAPLTWLRIHLQKESETQW
jgi:hypothetical protein